MDASSKHEESCFPRFPLKHEYDVGGRQVGPSTRCFDVIEVLFSHGGIAGGYEQVLVYLIEFLLHFLHLTFTFHMWSSQWMASARDQPW